MIPLIALEALESRRLFSSVGAVVTAKITHGHLKVLGTENADTIEVSQSSGTISVTSSGNSVYSGAISNLKAIIIRGYQGNDTITVDSSVTLPVVIYEQSGNDTINENSAGTGADTPTGFVIVKGDGNDDITTGAAQCFVEPGGGTDNITIGAGGGACTNGKGADTVDEPSTTNGAFVTAGAGDDVTLGPAVNGATNAVVSFKGDDTISSMASDTIFLRKGNILDGNSGDKIYLGGDSLSNLSGTTGATIKKNWPASKATFIHSTLEYFHISLHRALS